MQRSTLSKRLIGLSALSLAIITSGQSYANQPTAATPGPVTVEKSSTININQTTMQISGRLSLGWLNGEVNEIVYDPTTGSKLSHLEWQLENTVMLGAGFTLTPSSWISINLDLWTAVSEGSGSMDDYDWFINGADWTDWSSHDDTEVDSIWKFDLNAEFPIYTQPQLKVTGIIGIKREEYEMSASGGDYIYSENGFRNTIGSFQDGLLVISYEQVYTTPYIGLGFISNTQSFTFSGRVIGSGLVDLEATDVHHLRSLEFADDFESGTMFGLDLALSYRYSPKLEFMFGFNYLDYNETKGSTRITDLITGQSTQVGGDAAGSDNATTLFMAALVYNL